MTPGSWLFIRDGESIRVVRPHGCALVVLGPGALREIHDFPTEREMQAYQVSLAERLSERGWMLHGVDVERRSGLDRRNAERNTGDRRAQPH